MLAIAVHRNVPKPDVPESLRCDIEAAVQGHRPIAVIAIDGSPRLVLPPTVFPVTTNNDAARSDDVQHAVARLLQSVRTAAAQTDGSDVLAALSLGGDVARTALVTWQAPAGSAPARIAVIDSGLSDSGPLVLTRPGLETVVPQEVSTFLDRSNALPDLHGIDVLLVGFGYTAAPQEPLPQDLRTTVVSLWTSVTERSGASVRVLSAPRSGVGPDTRFTTRVVSFETTVAPLGRTKRSAQPIVFTDGSSVSFLPDSTTFRDESAAGRTLTGIGTWLREDPRRRAEVVGTTSSAGTEAGRQHLSAARASAVAKLLVKIGARPDQLTIRGAGYVAEPPDRTTNGALDPLAAAANRTVRITLTSG
ncbi:MAG: OmpA family protein [Kineosporiaceae bacterium]|nr:OmpA family protein [Kineosporiaceae bacterium]